MTTRSGFMKSSTATPSRRNSGLETTSNSTLAFFRDGGSDLFRGADGDGAFIDDDLIIFEDAAELVGYAKDIFEVGRSVFAGGCGEREEDDLRFADAIFEAGGEFQAFFLEVAEEEFFETGFIDGDMTVDKAFHFL